MFQKAQNLLLSFLNEMHIDFIFSASLARWIHTLITATFTINHFFHCGLKTLHHVSGKKTCQLIFCCVLVKYKPILVKVGMLVLAKTFNKNRQKLSTSPKLCASTNLGNMKWQIEPPNTTGSHCPKNRQTCIVTSKSHYLYIICSKCLPPARTTQARRRWRHVANRTFNEQRDSDCSLVFDASSFTDSSPDSLCLVYCFRFVLVFFKFSNIFIVLGYVW